MSTPHLKSHSPDGWKQRHSGKKKTTMEDMT